MKLPDDITDQIYGIRLLVFVEDAPQTNTYRQVLFTPEEFKRTSLSIGTVTEKNGHKEVIELQMSEETYTLPDLNEIQR